MDRIKALGREMIEERRLCGLEVGLEAFDAVEVGAGAKPFDVSLPIVPDLRQAPAEVQVGQALLGRAPSRRR